MWAASKSLGRDILWTTLGLKNFIRIMFIIKLKYLPHLRNPRSFNEKIQWLKLHSHMEHLSCLVDKYEVRKYVASRIGDKFLVPLIGVYETPQDIPFNSLPDSFVIKATHGCGWNIIVKNKTELVTNDILPKLDRWLDTNYYRQYGESPYKQLRGRIVIEELLTDPAGDLKDYKFHCSNGEPVFVQVHGDRFDTHRLDVYDLNWIKLPIWIQYNHPHQVERPDNFDQMISICRSLSQGFPYVRVDLYNINGQIYFGELTFMPMAGFGPIFPRKYDFRWGKLIDLNSWNTYPFRPEVPYSGQGTANSTAVAN